MTVRITYEVYTVGHAPVDQGRFGLEYDESWRHLQLFPISASLPLSQASWPASRAHAFFANLLPEGMAREAVCQRLGISVDNDVALLTALGDDTAGALRFSDSDAIDQPHEERRPVGSEWLERWSGGAPALPDDHPIRLSLAGAQHKISVVAHEGGWAIPATGEPSTHILKFDSGSFPNLSVNEFLTTRFAVHLGLNVVDAHLEMSTQTPYLVVERYDRRQTEDGVERIHQEDFCQILSLLPSQKYESEGGPSLRKIVDALRSVSSTPANDVKRLVSWTVFCALAGNADGHAKNLSVLYRGRGAKLTPFYDMVCTRVYKNLDRRMAFSVGGVRDSDQVDREAWQEFADTLGVAPRAVEREVRRQLNTWESAFDRAVADVQEYTSDAGIVPGIRKVVAKRTRALKRGIDA